MPVHFFNVGDVLTASDVNVWLAPLAGVKSADQSVSSTTLVNDADLRFAMAANSIYEFHAFIRYEADAAKGIKFSMTVPSGADARYMGLRNNFSGGWSGAGEFAASGTLDGQGQGIGTILSANLIGVAYTAGTAGNLIVQWAQFAGGSAPATILHQYSYVTGRRIG